MAWCGCSRKGRQCLASSGGGAAGWSVSTSTPYIPWQRRSNKALQPFSGGVYGWVFCAKNWQLGVLFLHIKQRLFHDGALDAQARQGLRFGHHRTDRGRRGRELPVEEPAQEPTAQQRERWTTPGPRHQGVDKHRHTARRRWSAIE